MKFIHGLLIASWCWIIFLPSCKNKQANPSSTGNTNVGTQSAQPVRTKPPSNYSDTIIIDKIAAVFYHPDSLQSKAIETITDKSIYESVTHESFYQMRNSRIVLHKDWPAVKIIEIKNARYLLFKKLNSENVLIDLNTLNDPYGLYLFDRIKDPLLTDMTNIDTDLYRYFSK